MDVYNTASGLFNGYSNFSDGRRSKMNPKYDLSNLKHDAYDYEEWSK